MKAFAYYPEKKHRMDTFLPSRATTGEPEEKLITGGESSFPGSNK